MFGILIGQKVFGFFFFFNHFPDAPLGTLQCATFGAHRHLRIPVLFVVLSNRGNLSHFTAQKHPHFDSPASDYIVKNYTTLNLLAMGKTASLLWFGILKFWQRCQHMNESLDIPFL